MYLFVFRNANCWIIYVHIDWFLQWVLSGYLETGGKSRKLHAWIIDFVNGNSKKQGFRANKTNSPIEFCSISHFTIIQPTKAYHLHFSFLSFSFDISETKQIKDYVFQFESIEFSFSRFLTPCLIGKVHAVISNGGDANKPFKIYVGYDPSEDLAYEVCRHSIMKRSLIPVEIIPIKQSGSRKSGLYWDVGIMEKKKRKKTNSNHVRVTWSLFCQSKKL